MVESVIGGDDRNICQREERTIEELNTKNLFYFPEDKVLFSRQKLTKDHPRCLP